MTLDQRSNLGEVATPKAVNGREELGGDLALGEVDHRSLPVDGKAAGHGTSHEATGSLANP